MNLAPKNEKNKMSHGPNHDEGCEALCRQEEVKQKGRTDCTKLGKASNGSRVVSNPSGGLRNGETSRWRFDQRMMSDGRGGGHGVGW